MTESSRDQSVKNSSPFLERLLSLRGKTALVTGATGVLGRHFSSALAGAGANVVLLDLDQDALNLLAQELAQTHGVQAVGVKCDLSSAETIREVMPPVIAKWQPEILLNNAASKGPDINRFFDPPSSFSPEVWREIMAVNLDAMFWMAQLVADALVARKTAGSLIQVSSIYGVVAPDQRIYEGSEYLGRQINTPAIYSASKGGVVALSRYMATYWGSHGIRSNTLTPGGVFSGQNDTFVKSYSSRVPLGRMGRAEDLIGAMVFLASDASAYITGQNIIIDGGWTAW
jgi:NAD(P)-dependent dehydrogenase (short-subunit alcohol dehydrogenase family)